jgi:aspartate/methionine/tyrosine aminotransferase
MTTVTNPFQARDPENTRPARFPPAPMSELVDLPVRYDLAESTSPPLRLGELLSPEVIARLEELDMGYGTSQGDPELRALIADGLGVDPGQVLVTAGGSTAMFLLALVLCRPGDHAVIATPCFPPARTVLEALDVNITEVALDFDNGYRLDVDAIAAALTPNTRLVSLASPQNPSGIRFTDQELGVLAERIDALAPQAFLLVDETYRETRYRDAPAPRSTARLAPRIVTCSSLSKSHGAAGLRIGWLTTTEPALYEELRIAKFTSLVAGSAVDELLAAEVLHQQERILAARLAPLTAALETLERWAVAHDDAVEFLRPDGGALCCLRLRHDRFDETGVQRFYAALAEQDARVAPGSWFGESDRVFRVGFGHLPAEEFQTALDRVARALSAS